MGSRLFDYWQRQHLPPEGIEHLLILTLYILLDN
jgi:hypothetical protein